MYEEKEELVTIIKQAAKERLQMEKQLAKIRPNAVSLLDNGQSASMYIYIYIYIYALLGLCK
jgi:hypothetical protein